MSARLRFLSSEQVVALHEALLGETGGFPGAGHRGSSYEGVDAAVQAVKNSYYDTVEELAAAYAVYIVQGHVFADGNKRTGAAALLMFLQVNRGPATLNDEQCAMLMIELQRRAETGEDVARLVQWIAGEITARPSARRRRRS